MNKEREELIQAENMGATPALKTGPRPAASGTEPGSEEVLSIDVSGVTEFKKRSVVRRIMNLLPGWLTPNQVTIFRGTLAAPIVVCAIFEAYIAALAIFVSAMLLDFVDGALAEARNIKTPLGAFLDPLADKALICGSLLGLAAKLPTAFLPVVAGICLVALALTVTRLVKVGRQGTIKAGSVAAKSAGKLKCMAETTAVGLLLIGLAADSMAVIWTAGALLLPALALAGLSLKSQIQS